MNTRQRNLNMRLGQFCLEYAASVAGNVPGENRPSYLMYLSAGAYYDLEVKMAWNEYKERNLDWKTFSDVATDRARTAFLVHEVMVSEAYPQELRRLYAKVLKGDLGYVLEKTFHNVIMGRYDNEEVKWKNIGGPCVDNCLDAVIDDAVCRSL